MVRKIVPWELGTVVEFRVDRSSVEAPLSFMKSTLMVVVELRSKMEGSQVTKEWN